MGVGEYRGILPKLETPTRYVLRNTQYVLRKVVSMNRREFFRQAAKTAAVLGLAARPLQVKADNPRSQNMQKKLELKKALILSMLPADLGTEDKFKMAADVGFQGMEIAPTSDPAEIEALRGASEKSGIPIHSIIFGGWRSPLSSENTEIAERGLNELKAGLQCARELGADSLLLVPGVVNAETRYKDAYERSQKRIKSLIPLAEKLGVVITVENVWNNFLYSPLEFARYVDGFKSRYVQAYFDVGNIVAFGWPEDWIRTLGKRIRKIHLKDFKREGRQWTNLRDGDVNWPEVRRALDEVGYSGYLTTELPGGDEKYLRDLSSRIDKIIAGE